ncbi:MAG TPA: GWxTD domain-containing protein [Candidatus Cloacimonadota bacterium]|nr:GWxTD domain-containing protein [Candidatus Cloacimonadota bacterium]
MKNTSIIRSLTLGLALLMLCPVLAAAEVLNMHLDYNRFLDAKGNTIMLVDYQALYRNLMFLAHSGGYFAQLDVNVQIANADSVIMEQTVTDNIGVTNKYDTTSSRKSYLNRLAFTLPDTTQNVTFRAMDKNSGALFFWQEDVFALPSTTLISDIELNSHVYADSSSYLQKFQRNKVVYEPLPSILLSKTYSEYAYIYMEIYPPSTELQSTYMLNLSLETGGQIVMDEYLDSSFGATTDALSLKIPLADFAPGKYSGTVTIQAGESTESRDFEFVLSEDIEQRFRVFEDIEDEYTLMRYFMVGVAPNWASMNAESKNRYVNNFWQNMAAQSRMSEDDIMKLVDERVKYANKNFSSLKPGWTSDMGRIYIRNGAPADIEEGTSSDDTRFVRKDYKIWKYNSGDKPVYLFIDI